MKKADREIPETFLDTLSTLLARSSKEGAALTPTETTVLEEALCLLARIQTRRLSGGESGNEDDLDLTGKSGPMRALRKTIRSLAASSASVLITGENGTGKERVASALVSVSSRRTGPFVKVNCGAFAEGILESALFGHVKGAFSGAINAHEGVFARADGGTLFLDEIGETSPATQVKLLRVLQEGTFVPVGGVHEKRVNVRVIAATNRDLDAMRKSGTFRDDLYFRLAVICITVPPLRARKEDIPALVQSFIDRESAREGHGLARTATSELLGELCEHSWPGNVRELENTVRRLMALSRDSTVLHSGLLDEHRPPAAKSKTRLDLARGIKPLVHEFEREIVRQALAECGTTTSAARLLGITQPALREKMERIGVATQPTTAKAV